MRISYTLWLFYLIPLLLWIASIRALVRHFVSRIPCIGHLFPFSCCWPKKHAWAQSWRQSTHFGKHFRISVAFFHKQTWGGLGLSVLPLKWGQGTNEQMTLKITAFVMWTNGQFGGRNGLQYKLLSQIQRGLVRSKMSGQVRQISLQQQHRYRRCKIPHAQSRSEWIS